MKPKRLRGYLLVFAMATAGRLLAAPQGAPSSTPQKQKAGTVFVSLSSGFSIEYREGYKLVSVAKPWPGAKRSFTYILYPRGEPRPAGPAADRYIETPLRRVVTFSTTYLPQIAAIGGADSVVGVDTAAFVNTPEIRARIASGKTFETTRNWSPDLELILALTPDAIFSYGMGNEWDSHPKLAEAGLPVVIDGDWNEPDPLARAQWIVFIAAFYDKEDEAASIFERIAAEYRGIKALAAAAKERPTVLVNGPFQGTWTVSGGESYMARFISDAGGAYLWADDRSGAGLTLSVEAVYERGLRAGVWLNPALHVERTADLLAMDSRFGDIPAVVSANVWNNTLRMSPGGGNDYFESSIINPDKVLADLVKIFHPDLLADRPFTYYKRVAR
jgi:iron complex transport system substrate-binding protein